MDRSLREQDCGTVMRLNRSMFLTELLMGANWPGLHSLHSKDEVKCQWAEPPFIRGRGSQNVSNHQEATVTSITTIYSQWSREMRNTPKLKAGLAEDMQVPVTLDR